MRSTVEYRLLKVETDSTVSRQRVRGDLLAAGLSTVSTVMAVSRLWYDEVEWLLETTGLRAQERCWKENLVLAALGEPGLGAGAGPVEGGGRGV